MILADSPFCKKGQAYSMLFAWHKALLEEVLIEVKLKHGM
jgi:hypothetical protein